MLIRWIHLVASSVWVGGLITMAGLVAGLRRQGVEREVLQQLARSFGKVSWGAMAVAVLSGGWMAVDDIDQPLLAVKLGLVAVVALLAAFHQFAGRKQSAAARGVFQGLILAISLAIVWVAVQL